MPRNSYQMRFEQLAQSALPPHLAPKIFAPGVFLHPLITENGWDNSKTIFGLIQPASHGKSLIVQVSPRTEKLMAKNSPEADEFLRADLRVAADLWDTRAVPHEIALQKIVVL